MHPRGSASLSKPRNRVTAILHVISEHLAEMILRFPMTLLRRTPAPVCRAVAIPWGIVVVDLHELVLRAKIPISRML